MRVHAATGHRHDAIVAFDRDTAVVEVANTCGLATLPDGVLAPMTASSYGFGEAIRAALPCPADGWCSPWAAAPAPTAESGCWAPSATASSTAPANCWPPPQRISTASTASTTVAAVDLSRIELIVAGDVTSPLLGLTGAAAVFGPHKGATAAQVAQLDAGLDNLVAAFTRSGHHADTAAPRPGSGAAGGIGFAAMLLGATTASERDYFLDLLDFDRHVGDVDLVITGEGRLDHQTLQGKLPAAVALRAAPTPVVAVVGRNDLDDDTADTGFADIFAVADLTDRDTSHDPDAPQNCCSTSEPTSEAANLRRVPVVAQTCRR